MLNIIYRHVFWGENRGGKILTLREKNELREKTFLSSYATLSAESKGRKREEVPCEMRMCFQRDRDRIIHCKSFRRLKHKTQVFLSPEGDHYRTRLTHTLEVSQIARTIARALMLNEDLTEAIALGHDLGHTPFGHAGERALNHVAKEIGFEHSKQSIRVVERLEQKGKGLNLCFEVLDGIENHQTKSMPSTLEGKVVRLSDKIAYINHDIDDAIRGKIICEEDIPKEYKEILGNTTKSRLNTMISDIINNSYEKSDIVMSEQVSNAMVGIRKYMFSNVYTSPVAKGEEGKAVELVTMLYQYYFQHLNELPKEYQEMLVEGEQAEQVVCDYIAGMTDNYAISVFRSIFEPKSWK